MQKYVETSQQIIENIEGSASLSEEERDALETEDLKRRFRRKFKRECTPKEIRKQIEQLRLEKKNYLKVKRSMVDQT
ncbi:MAG: hypothetical protein WCF03_20520 [Nitrososphaeraceae archaeon]